MLAKFSHACFICAIKRRPHTLDAAKAQTHSGGCCLCASSARFKNVTTLFTTLAPGELLYIPPFWAHRFETSGEDLAISVTVINPSETEAFWKSVNRKWPVEYEDAFKTPGSQIVAARYLIDTVLRAALGSVNESAVVAFMGALIDTRYRTIMEEHCVPQQLHRALQQLYPSAKKDNRGIAASRPENYLYYTDQIQMFPQLNADAGPRELLKYRDRGIPNNTRPRDRPRDISRLIENNYLILMTASIAWPFLCFSELTVWSILLVLVWKKKF